MAVLCSLLSCSVTDNTQEEAETDEMKTIYIDYTVDGAVTGFFIPQFESTDDVQYASDEDKETWREDLICALSSPEMKPYNEYYEVPDGTYGKSRATAVRWGSEGVGLIDVTGDGIPELAQLWYHGGSSGNCGFQLYDIKTGARIGGISTGGWSTPLIICDESGKEYQSFADEYVSYGEWAIYKHIHTGEYRVFGNFSYGGGNKEFFFSEMVYDRDTDFYRAEQIYMYKQDWDHESKTEDNIHVSVSINYGWSFYDDWTGKAEEDANEALEFFSEVTSNYLLVEGTPIIVIPWSEIEGYSGSTQEELAVKMADALLNSEQKFVVP